MTALLIVDDPEEWPLKIPAAEVISADDYLREQRFSELKQARVYNLCDSYGYQTAGYYVSLLAAARGHRTMPGVATIQDMKSRSLLRADDELEELIQRSLHTIVSKRFELSIYFGCNLAERHADLSRALFNLFPVPLMRASFSKSSSTGKWRPSSIAPLPVGDLPSSHRAVPAQSDREPLRSPRPGGPLGSHRPIRVRSRDSRERRRALAAVEPRGVEALRAGGAAPRLRRRVPGSRRLRPDRRVRRAVHPRDDQRQPSHLPIREPRAGGRHGGHRRPGIDHPLRQQGVPLRARETARSRDSADDGRERRAYRRHHQGARLALRAEAARQRVLGGRLPGRYARGAVGRACSGCCRAAISSSCSRSCRRSSTGASASSTANRCSSAATTWRTATGRSITTARSARRRATARRSPWRTRRARC